MAGVRDDGPLHGRRARGIAAVGLITVGSVGAVATLLTWSIPAALLALFTLMIVAGLVAGLD